MYFRLFDTFPASQSRAAGMRLAPNLSHTTSNNPVQGLVKVVEITTEGADAHIDALAKKYMDVDQYPYRKEGEARVKYRIAPEKVVAHG